MRNKNWIELNASEKETNSIRDAMHRGHPIGSTLFAEAIEMKLGIRLLLNKPGRPRSKVQQIKEAGVRYDFTCKNKSVLINSIL